MRLLLDEDSSDAVLVALLRREGYDVVSCPEAGLEGEADAVQFTRAIRESRVVLSQNHDDFDARHLLVREARGSHPGVFIVRRDNDPRRDLSLRGIVSAIGKLLRSGATVSNEFHILNHWR